MVKRISHSMRLYSVLPDYEGFVKLNQGESFDFLDPRVKNLVHELDIELGEVYGITPICGSNSLPKSGFKERCIELADRVDAYERRVKAIFKKHDLIWQ